MAKSLKKKSPRKQGPKKGLAYFTTQALERAVKKGTKKKAENAKSLIGYTVKELNGWVIKEHKNGRIEKISRIPKTKRPNRLVLD
jgi:hypothetical protein